MMTKEMQALIGNLKNVKVKNIVMAYDYLGEQINDMYMNETIDFQMSTQALKRINKDFKILKKHYKGKITINPKSLYMKYQDGTEERFFLECLVKLAEYNHF
jgi:NDP-sugar pyrophosphorylase family protein